MTAIFLMASSGLAFGQQWDVGGNSISDPETEFIGTTNNRDFRIRTDDREQVTINPEGYVGIGTMSPTTKFHLLSGDAMIENGNLEVRRNTGSTAASLSLIGKSNGYSSSDIIMGNHDKFPNRFWLINYREVSGFEDNLNFLFYNSATVGYAGVMTLSMQNGGAVGIGPIDETDMPGDHRLYVDGSIICTELNVQELGDWADFVFEPDYVLPSLAEKEAFILENKHLPNMPSAAEVIENGYGLSDMDAKLLRQIEELTLHVIQLQKENQAIKAELGSIKSGK